MTTKKKMINSILKSVDQEKHSADEPGGLDDIFSMLPFGNMGNNQLSERGIIFIDDQINKHTIKDPTHTLLNLHFNDDFTDTIQIIINSPGGYTDAGWGFIDVMRFIKNPIRTIAIGESASMATMIFIAGDERVMSHNSTIMIHNFSSGHVGSFDDLIAGRKSDEIQNNKIVEHFREYSNLKTDKLIKENLLTGRDNFLTPQEALKFGLCDKISQNRKRKTNESSRKKSTRKNS